MIEQFNTVEKVDKAFEELKSYWNALLSKYFLESTMKNSTVWLIYGISTVYGYIQHVKKRFIL